MLEKSELIRQARAARERAQAPHSGYRVGAAILTGTGQVYMGCNVESGAFSTTLCAERVAIFAAIAAGQNHFQALAVASEDGGTPCGACRQVIYEQCGDIPIFVVGSGESPPEEYTTSQLLPHPFELKRD